jgi:hypothetical protein
MAQTPLGQLLIWRLGNGSTATGGVAPSRSRSHIGVMNLELSDDEAEALIQELSGTINYARYPHSPRIQTPASNPPEAEARASARAPAAEGLCAAIERPIPATRLDAKLPPANAMRLRKGA